VNARYAIYFAPLRGSDLARFGSHWLGRDAESGAALEQAELGGLHAEELRALTEAPRHYGFHGTLKPPFRLADGADAQDVHAALSSFARRQAAFELRGLQLRAIGDFLALVPSEDSPALSRLADACVTDFDAFRAPLESDELARRHAAGLTLRQMELLARWGYPYVLDEFRFHLTLTGPIADEATRGRISSLIAPLAGSILGQPVPVRDVCLFYQPDRQTAFRLIARFPFGS
jgi:putative phosphonate metabolism protein